MRALVVFALLLHQTLGWDVLIANVLSTGSHQTVSGYVANLLSDSGHSVTYISPNIPGYLHKAIDKKELPRCTKVMNGLGGAGSNETLTFTDILGKIDTLLRACERWYEEPAVQEVMESGKRFDMILTLGLFDSCALGLAHHLGVNNSIIHMPAPLLLPPHISMLGLPLYSSSVDVDNILLREHEDVKNSVIARATNLLKRVVFDVLYVGLTSWYVEPVIRNNVPSYPGYKEAYKTVKLMLMHSHHHPLIDGPTPFGPGVLTLGGSLCKDYNPLELSPELKEFVDAATDGFIYISFGSVQKDVLPEEEAKWIETFRELPYKVVWKQSKPADNLPENVRVFSWVPQMSLLQHPHIKLFITHGGYASKMEALCAAVPLLVVPRFAQDQYYTAERIAKLGLGDQIPELDTTPVSEIRSKILQVTGHDRYANKMRDVRKQLMSTRVTDEQILGYLDTVISGHSFLPGYQPWYQYYYLDIFLGPVLTVLVIRYLYNRNWK